MVPGEAFMERQVSYALFILFFTVPEKQRETSLPIRDCRSVECRTSPPVRYWRTGSAGRRPGARLVCMSSLGAGDTPWTRRTASPRSSRTGRTISARQDGRSPARSPPPCRLSLGLGAEPAFAPC